MDPDQTGNLHYGHLGERYVEQLRREADVIGTGMYRDTWGISRGYPGILNPKP